MPSKLYLLITCFIFLIFKSNRVFDCFLYMFSVSIPFLTVFCQLVCPFLHCILSVRTWLLWCLFSKVFSGQLKEISPSLNSPWAFYLSDGIHISLYIEVGYIPFGRKISLSGPSLIRNYVLIPVIIFILWKENIRILNEDFPRYYFLFVHTIKSYVMTFWNECL